MNSIFDCGTNLIGLHTQIQYNVHGNICTIDFFNREVCWLHFLLPWTPISTSGFMQAQMTVFLRYLTIDFFLAWYGSMQLREAENNHILRPCKNYFLQLNIHIKSRIRRKPWGKTNVYGKYCEIVRLVAGWRRIESSPRILERNLESEFTRILIFKDIMEAFGGFETPNSKIDLKSKLNSFLSAWRCIIFSRAEKAYFLFTSCIATVS